MLTLSLIILGAMLAYSSVKNGHSKLAFIGSMVSVLGMAL